MAYLWRGMGVAVLAEARQGLSIARCAGDGRRETGVASPNTGTMYTRDRHGEDASWEDARWVQWMSVCAGVVGQAGAATRPSLGII